MDQELTSHALDRLAGSRRMLLHAASGAKTWNNVMAAILNVWCHMRTPAASIDINLKNVPAKFHPDPIWNDGA